MSYTVDYISKYLSFISSDTLREIEKDSVTSEDFLDMLFSEALKVETYFKKTVSSTHFINHYSAEDIFSDEAKNIALEKLMTCAEFLRDNDKEETPEIAEEKQYWNELHNRIIKMEQIKNNPYLKVKPLTDNETSKARYTPMITILEHYGLDQSHNLVKNTLRCPLHNGSKNNFCFKDSFYYCFSKCGSGKDTIDFVMKYKGHSFAEAVREILMIIS